jgi:hypothetical protein
MRQSCSADNDAIVSCSLQQSCLFAAMISCCYQLLLLLLVKGLAVSCVSALCCQRLRVCCLWSLLFDFQNLRPARQRLLPDSQSLDDQVVLAKAHVSACECCSCAGSSSCFQCGRYLSGTDMCVVVINCPIVRHCCAGGCGMSQLLPLPYPLAADQFL